MIASSFCPFLPLHLGLQPGIFESGMEAEEPGSLQDILQQKLGSRRMAGGCLCSGAKCRPRVRQVRSPPGAGENGKRPRHPKNEVCVTAARCSLPGAGARETLAELVDLLQPLILAAAPEAVGSGPSPSRFALPLAPRFLRIPSEQPGPIPPRRTEHLLDQCFRVRDVLTRPAQGTVSGSAWPLSI